MVEGSSLCNQLVGQRISGRSSGSDLCLARQLQERWERGEGRIRSSALGMAAPLLSVQQWGCCERREYLVGGTGRGGEKERMGSGDRLAERITSSLTTLASLVDRMVTRRGPKLGP